MATKMSKKAARAFALHWIITDLGEHIDNADGLAYELDEELGEASAEKIRREYRAILDGLQKRFDKMSATMPESAARALFKRGVF